MADRFYTNFALAPGPVIIQGAEAHHLATVRRFRPGDQVILFNGDGCEYQAELVVASKKNVSLTVLSVDKPQRELKYRLEIAAPLPKGDRGDFMIEKLTELGVTDFVPLCTERSIVHPHGAKLDRLRRTVIEASKQCGRNVLMRVREIANWCDYYCGAELPTLRWLGHTTSKEPANGLTLRADTAIAIGPEGGFTEEEVALARNNGWKCISLGARVLRVETAAIALAALASNAG